MPVPEGRVAVALMATPAAPEPRVMLVEPGARLVEHIRLAGAAGPAVWVRMALMARVAATAGRAEAFTAPPIMAAAAAAGHGPDRHRFHMVVSAAAATVPRI